MEDMYVPIYRPECRICLEPDEETNLVSPCGCTGSVQYTHLRCVQKWIEISKNTHCKMCMNRFDVPQRPITIVKNVLSVVLYLVFYAFVVTAIIFSTNDMNALVVITLMVVLVNWARTTVLVP